MEANAKLTSEPPDLPPAQDGNPAGSESEGKPVCRARLRDGSRCGASPNPNNPNTCDNGHFLPSNKSRGVAAQRYLDENKERVIAKRDRHLRDRHLTPTTAPEDVLDFCTNLGELPIQMEWARRFNRPATYKQLLDAYISCLRALDARAPSMDQPAERRWAHFSDDEVQAMLHDLEAASTFDELQALRRAAVCEVQRIDALIANRMLTPEESAIYNAALHETQRLELADATIDKSFLAVKARVEAARAQDEDDLWEI